MIEINGVELRNIVEQVAKNQADIAAISSGVKIAGTASDPSGIPADLAAGLAYLVGEPGAYELYVKTADNQLVDVGEWPARGPQGIQGPQGDAAHIGNVDSSTETIDSALDASVTVSKDGENLSFHFAIPKGAKGNMGNQGIQGPQGPQGPQGETGPQGAQAVAMKILYTVATSGDLPLPDTLEDPLGSAILVGTEPPYALYVVTMTSDADDTLMWKNLGPLEPNQVTVDDHLDADSTNPVENGVIVAALNQKANIDSYYGTMGVGFASSAASLETTIGNDDSTPFSFTTAGGSADIETGYQKLKKLVGVSLVKNQIIQYGDFSSSSGWSASNGTLSVSSNTATLTTTSSGYAYIGRNITLYAHSYLMMCTVNSSAALTNFRMAWESQGIKGNTLAANTWTTFFGVATISTSAGTSHQIQLGSTQLMAGDVVQYKNCFVIDLTQRYGNNDVVNAIIGNDSSKYVERLLQFDPQIMADLSYDAGSFVHSQSAKLKTIGYNQWDEQWESGSYSAVNGSKTVNANQIRSKNFIPVIPGMTYFGFVISLIGQSGGTMVCNYYDANKNFIGYGSSLNGTTNTMPSNCQFITIWFGNAYGTTYKNDVCLFLYWDGSKIAYEPYREELHDLPNVSLKGVLKAVDGHLSALGDELYPDSTGQTKIGTYTFTGTETWNTSGNAKYAYIPGVSPYIKISTANILCPELPTTTPDNLYAHGDTVKGIACNNTNIWVDGTSYLDMTGKTIIFELATPSDLNDQGSFDEILYMDDFGTVQFLDSADAEIPGLQGAEFFYEANVAGFAESLYAATGGDAGSVALTSDLVVFPLADDAADGTYVYKAVKSGSTITYAWVLE